MKGYQETYEFKMANIRTRQKEHRQKSAHRREWLQKQKRLQHTARRKRRCIICGALFTPRKKESKTCGSLHANKYRYLLKKGLTDANIRKLQMDKLDSVIADHKNESSRKAAIDASPDLNDLVPVRIDNRTVIYIRPGKDPEIAKQNYLHKYAQTI